MLGFLRVPHAEAGIARARALVRMSGAGHSAAILAPLEKVYGMTDLGKELKGP